MEVVKHEIKSQLAKLLATEDLIVEHRKVDTAQFNVRSRVLTLPNWERASNNIFDSLVAHEVGHALYTPDRDWFNEVEVPQQFVNIVEDARIEKLMKRRYAGLAKTFYNGYNELNDKDFFEIDGEDLSVLNLADRVNLYFKVGSWVDISFSISEAKIVSLIDKAETFDDTLEAAIELYNFCKKEQEKQRKIANISSKEGTEKLELELDSDFNPESNDNNDNTDSQEESEVDLDYQPSSKESGGDLSDNDHPVSEPNGGETNDDSLDIKTVSALSDALKSLSDNDSVENTYIELPKVNLKNIIINNSTIHNQIKFHWQEEQKRFDNLEYVNSDCLFTEVDNDFVKFKRDAQKEVNYLVKEFECKKAATAYARSTTARTGVLDTAKLHTYKFNEDLFKKINVVPDGKNHGLIFILDWSGSMSHIMMDTIKQLYNLLWFCKKVSIPFEVYAFTNDCPYTNDDKIRISSYDRKDGLALIQETFSLMNLFTSKVRNKELDEQMKDIFRICCAFNHDYWTQYHIPIGLNLSGTPLNESLVCLHQIIPQFKKQNNLEKVQCVILTDGEGAPLRYSKEIQRNWEDEPFMGSAYIHDHCVLRNRKTGHTYSCRGLGYWADITDMLLFDLRQSFPNTNFIGIRILANRDAGHFVRRYLEYSEEYAKVMDSWRKEKSFSIKSSGYHSYFGLSSNTLANDDEFDVQEDATKAQIKRAFVKSLKTKKMNKKVLGEFIELVA